MRDVVGPWAVMVEEQIGGAQEIRRWRVYEEREEARADALNRVRTYEPPGKYKERTQFKHDEDNYTVVLDGTWSRRHFVVRVAEVID